MEKPRSVGSGRVRMAAAAAFALFLFALIGGGAGLLSGCGSQTEHATQNTVPAESAASTSGSTGAATASVSAGRTFAPPGADATRSASHDLFAGPASTSAEKAVAASQLAPASLPAVAARRQPAASLRARSVTAATAALPPATQNPNLYLQNTYIGGSGERDRLETLIANGVLVQGKRVKLEAFSRTYAQTFPIPTDEALAVTADAEHAKIVTQGDRTFLQVGLQAMKNEAARRPPLNIALVLDRSGSMQSENKLDYAKQAALALLDRLRPGDVLSLVAFDDHAELLAPARPMTAEAKAVVRRRIENISPGSGTNIFDGLALGYEQTAKNAKREGGVSLVLLLSDGEVTAGVRDPDRFRALASRNADEDIQTTSVGMGVAFNEDLMLSIAREGKGNYHFLRTGADTRTVFAKELDDLTQIVAKAVRLRIVLAPGVGLVRVLGANTLDAVQTRQAKADEQKIDRRVADELGIAPDRQRQPDEPGIKLLIPHFLRGDSHIVLLEIAVPPGRGERKLADVFLKYKDLAHRANRQTQTATAITYTPDRTVAVASLNRSVKKNLLGFQTGEALAKAGQLVGQNRPAEAVKTLDERMVVLGVAARQWNDRDLDRDGRLLSRYKMVVAQLAQPSRVASADLGAYLQKSLTYSGYQRTR